MNYSRYQIVREIGRGSMGVVYQALDPRIDRLVALKVLRQDRMASEEIVRRFLKEAKAIGRLTHPHIVTVYDIGEEEGTVYIAMEFIEGVSLAELIEEKRLDEKDIITIGIQLAETLDFAHQRRVVHRDIKPSNIIVQKGNNIKITDFGIAHIEDPSGTMQTQLGEILGTPAYMSPEQVMGQPVDGRSDIFSLGIILYELSTGQRPFGDRNQGFLTVFNEILKNTPEEPLVINPRIPKKFSGIIKKALEKEPEKRFQTGNSFAEALRECLSDKGKGKSESERPPVQKRKPQIHYAIPFAVVLVVAVLIGGGIYISPSLKEKLGTIPANKDSSSSKEKEVDSSIPNKSQQTEPEDKGFKIPYDKQVITSSDAAADKPGTEKIEAIPPEDERKKTTRSSSDSISERSNVKPSKVADQRKPRDERKFQSSSEVRDKPKDLTRGAEESSLTNVPVKPVPKFAFLKVSTTPPGAEVYIDGTLKGMTPIILKLDLGQYKIRLTRAGHQEVERMIKLDRMTEYPIMEHLKPLE